MRKTLQRFTLCATFFCGLSFSAFARICERVAVPQPHDETAVAIFEVGRSEAFKGRIVWKFWRWVKRDRQELQQKLFDARDRMKQGYQKRDHYLVLPTKEDLRQDILAAQEQVNSYALQHNFNRANFPGTYPVILSWDAYTAGLSHLEQLRSRWEKALLHDERKQIIADYESGIASEAQLISELRLELLKESPLWGKQVTGAQLRKVDREPAFIEIEDSQGRFFTWQPQEDQARLATVVVD